MYGWYTHKAISKKFSVVVTRVSHKPQDTMSTTRMQHPLSDADYLRIGLKLRQLVTPGLNNEDAEKLTTRKNIERFSLAFTHRWSRTKENLEVDEILGDKAIGYSLMRWLRKTFPHETRESVFSLIVAKFLSKTKLSQYSNQLGLPELLIKPTQFQRTKTDEEDIFEAVMGAIVIIGDETFGEGMGIIIVQSIVVPIFESENIDPANLRDYIDSVSLLKMASNVMYNTDPKLPTEQYTTVETDGRKTLWFGAKAILKVPKVDEKETKEPTKKRFQKVNNEEVELAKLEETEYARTKQEAKEAVARKALQIKGWTYDYIDEQRQEKDAANQEKYKTMLAERIQGIREEILGKKMQVAAFVPTKVVVKGKTKYVGAASTTSKPIETEDAELTRRFGPNLAAQLRLPVDVTFEIEKDEAGGDTIVLLFTGGIGGIQEERGAIPVRPSQLHTGYRQLVLSYIGFLRTKLGLPPIPTRK